MPIKHNRIISWLIGIAIGVQVITLLGVVNTLGNSLYVVLNLGLCLIALAFNWKDDTEGGNSNL